MRMDAPGSRGQGRTAPVTSSTLDARGWVRAFFAVAAVGLFVSTLGRPVSAHDLDPGAGGLGAPWDAWGADSLGITITGQYPVASPAGIFGVAAYHDEASGEEVALLAADSLYVIDITDPAHPTRLTAYPTFGVSVPDGNAYLSVKTHGTFAYAAERHGPIGIIDLSLPLEPLRVGEIPESDFCACSQADLVDGRPVCKESAVPEVHRIFVDEQGILYVAGIRYGEGTHMYDVREAHASDPLWLCHEHTRPEGTVGFYDHDTYVSNGIIITSKSMGLRWEILEGNVGEAPFLCGASPSVCGDNGGHPELLTWFPQDAEQAEGTHAHSAGLVPDTPYLVTADELEDGHIRIWDTTPVFQATPEPPTYIAEFKPDDTCHSVHDPYVIASAVTGGTECYVAWYNKGIQIFRLGPDGAPTRVAYYEHPFRWHELDGPCCDPTRAEGAYCYGVPFLDFLPEGRFVASELHNGLLVGRAFVDPSGAGEGSTIDAAQQLRVIGLPGVRIQRIFWNHAPAGDETPPLEVLSPGGVLVASLTPHAVRPGQVEYRWSGRDDDGAPLPSGVYFAHVRTEPQDGLGRPAYVAPSAKLFVLR
ncbi:MAG: FlgD immunoglobulin-like domain containing protein [Candidatus Eisenbacteria bacterium]